MDDRKVIQAFIDWSIDNHEGDVELYDCMESYLKEINRSTKHIEQINGTDKDRFAKGLSEIRKIGNNDNCEIDTLIEHINNDYIRGYIEGVMDGQEWFFDDYMECLHDFLDSNIWENH